MLWARGDPRDHIHAQCLQSFCFQTIDNIFIGKRRKGRHDNCPLSQTAEQIVARLVDQNDNVCTRQDALSVSHFRMLIELLINESSALSRAFFNIYLQIQPFDFLGHGWCHGHPPVGRFIEYPQDHSVQLWIIGLI